MTAFFFPAVALSGTSAPDAARAGWSAGVAQGLITPAEPMPMSGFAGRENPAEGKLHDLWVKAVALADPNGKTALLLTADVVGVPKSLSDRVAEELQKSFDLPRANLMIAVSHTHGSPMILGNLPALYDMQESERELIRAYRHFLEEKMIEVAAAALQNVAPAELAWGIGEATFAVNRRNNPAPDVPRLREQGKLKGPVDHDVPVLKVSAVNGDLLAIVFGYACHCTVLRTREWSNDYVGFAQLKLQEDHPGAVALFFAGCGGDQNALPRRELHFARDYGHRLADAVNAVLADPPNLVCGEFGAEYELVDLPFADLPSREELEQHLTGEDLFERLRAEWLLATIAEKGALDETYPYPIQIWRLGSGLTWLGLGGEPVVAYSLRLKEAAGRGSSWVAAYCNDVMGYIPTRGVLEEGGYEPVKSVVFYGLPSPWDSSVEARIMERIHALMHQHS